MTIVRDSQYCYSPTFETVQNLSLGCVEWSCAVVIITTHSHHVHVSNCFGRSSWINYLQIIRICKACKKQQNQSISQRKNWVIYRYSDIHVHCKFASIFYVLDVHTIADVRSINRYKSLHVYLHVNNNSKLYKSENKIIKLYKIQPVLCFSSLWLLTVAKAIDEKIRNTYWF